ncbi:hypothetical protein D9758_011870 [Tetrapyrgos nigripes]|uniref:NmrA-like domain-containing protein n=1 Tax=Tetrapyrgos nigripes TaxID=182062 RepID=A0A8H5CSB0_9AGAR|nr:hypothetical protein D9758_011870 [Tetrapyrgos nigripes]
MSTNTNSSFAVLGSNGTISPFIIDAFAKNPKVKKLIVVTRPSSKAPSSLPSNVESISVDYNNRSALVEVFKKHSTDVVVSTLSAEAILDAQKKAAVAAKEAGVKLFVPSEYGIVTTGFAGKGTPGTGNPLVDKDVFAEFLKSIDLPYARVFSSLWHQAIPFVVDYDTNQKVNIIGKGETPVSFTAQEDVGGFVSHVLTTVPLPQLSNAQLRLEGDCATLRQLADRFGQGHAFVETVPGPIFREILLKQFESGAGSTGWDNGKQKENPKDSEEGAGSANKLWEGHVWKKLEDVVKF